MRDSHTSEMRWYSEISTAAFCESLDLRRILLLKRQSFARGRQRLPLLEPASAEFISALAAGKNSRHTLQVGCGLSTLALAAAARATNSCLLSVHHEPEKQDVVRYFLKEMELSDYVRFITEDPLTFIPRREGLEFVLLSGPPERYIEIFDVLKLKKGAIVVADNALDDATNDYIRHVRRQPGVDSSTLPLSRGIEVTKIVTWKIFNRGRKRFEGIEELLADKESTRRPGVIPGLYSSSRLSARSGDASSRFSDFDAEVDLDQSKAASSIGSPTHSDGHCKSGYATSIADSEDKLQQHEVIEQQFKSIQSLAEQWRIQLASLGESSGNSLSSAEESRRKLPDDEPLTLFNSHEQAVASPSREASGDLMPGSPQKQESISVYSHHSRHEFQTRKVQGQSCRLKQSSFKKGKKASTCLKDLLNRLVVLFYGVVQCCSQNMMDLENNDTSLPSSEASMTERVAPEPLESAEVLSTEDAVPDLDQPTFQVKFQIDNDQTEVTVEGVDQDMLLFDLTQAFYETGVSVKRAKIATQDICIVDVFYVVDGVTKGPLSESREEEVRKRILERLLERRQELGN